MVQDHDQVEEAPLLANSAEEELEGIQEDKGQETHHVPSRFAFPGKLNQWRKSRKRITFALIVTAILVLLLSWGGSYVYKTKPVSMDGQSPPWYPTPPGGSSSSWSNSYSKAARLVGKMSLAEKVNITTGTGWAMGLCVGNTGPANDVGFPSLCLQDGPLGIRFADQITAFPAGITVGATWNRELMYNRGRAHGLEARLKGVNVLLGPAMGPLGKLPAGGRNWEGFGADPVLQGVAAAQTIKGIQDEGVIATAKHYILNEQEHYRQSFEWGIPTAMSSNADDRTLHELYLWPFTESIRAGVASIMCSYQMANNSYACGNSKLLNGILKDELGFQGFVQSDWLAQRSGVASALAGLDMSMPGDGLHWADGNSLWGSELTLAVLNGSLPMSRLNDMTLRIVAAYYQLNQDDASRYPSLAEGPNFSSWTDDKIGLLYNGSGEGPTGIVNKFIDVQGEGEAAHGKLVRQIAAEGTVLVKNEWNTLPINKDGWGINSNRKYKVAIIGEDATEGRGKNACKDRGCNQGTLASGWGSGAVDFPYLVTPLDALKSAFNPSTVEITVFPTNDIPNSGSLSDKDLCLTFINADAGEGYLEHEGTRGDRNDLYAQKGGDKLASAVGEQCGNVVVVIHSVGAVVVEDWIDMESIKAVLYAHLPGQESGNALVDILFGDVNPSGKLPYTVGKSLEDYGPGAQVLYKANGEVPQQDYNEGLYIDYRHFDKYNIEPRFEFGYGLSYTSFALSNLKIDVKKPRSPFPAARPPGTSPPQISDTIPPVSESIFPKGLQKIKNLVYPYINSEDEVKEGEYPYPDGYDVIQTPSEAGGGEGGNPSLFDIHVEVTVKVTNTGEKLGKEVVQLYLSFPDNIPVDPTLDAPATSNKNETIDFPVKALRAFQKIELAPSQQGYVKLHLTRKDLSYWSVVHQNWIMPTQGHFKVHVGTSSRNLPLKGLIK